jgi:hypothetical protein
MPRGNYNIRGLSERPKERKEKKRKEIDGSGLEEHFRVLLLSLKIKQK